MTDHPAVQTRGLSKRYGGAAVLDGLDLQVAAGSVFAMLGPNGAGKTTTVRILATLVAPDGGTASVAGFDVVRGRHEVRRRISLTGQFAAVDDRQTGAENLRTIGRLAGLGRSAATRRAAELLERFDLTDAAGRRAGSYSGGMRRRLDLAAGLTVAPDVMFLDEPTTGLDPRSRREIWAMVGELARQGTTVFLTTQYLEEADELAGRIAVLDRGRLVAEGTPAQLKERVSEQRLELTCLDGAAHDAVARRVGGQAALAAQLVTAPARLLVSVPTDGTARHVRHVVELADPQGCDLRSFEVRKAGLDDVFLALTGHRAAVAVEPNDDHETKEQPGV